MVDAQHKAAKRLCDRLRAHIVDVRPDHPYPAMLASNVVDGSMVQRFFAEHLPSLTEKQARPRLSDLFVELVFSTINKRDR